MNGCRNTMKICGVNNMTREQMWSTKLEQLQTIESMNHPLLKKQRALYAELNCIGYFDFYCTQRLPDFVVRILQAKGLGARRLGGTTYKYSRWGVFRLFNIVKEIENEKVNDSDCSYNPIGLFVPGRNRLEWKDREGLQNHESTENALSNCEG